MRLTKEDLDSLEESARCHNIFAPSQKRLNKQLELIRVARLGLWAEEHGIPTVKMADSYCFAGAVERSPDGPGLSDQVQDALAALPKE